MAWFHAGCAVIPIRADGSKAPLVSWRSYRQAPPDRRQVEQWFTGNPPGLAVVCGSASAGLEMLELEGRAVDEGLGQALIELLAQAGLADLWRRLTSDGYWERTPSGGVHILYRISGAAVDGNLKLARRPATEYELSIDPADKVKTLAETRGEGGYTIVAPSHGTVHESRRPWVALNGSTPARIPTINAEERTALLNAVRALDEMPAARSAVTHRPVAPQGGQDLTPGDDFERRTDWIDILGPVGWTLVHTVGRTRYWRRPGKNTGISATTGRADDRDRLFVFSSSTMLETDTPLTKFHVFAVLHHAGDHSAAARALRQNGYGHNPDRQSAPSSSVGREKQAVARVTREAPSPPAAWGPTEDGLARALVAHHGHELRYCPQRGAWLLWSGHRWVWDDAERHREFVRGLARQLPAAGGWRRFRSQALSAGGVSGVVRLARSDPAVTVSLTALDARPYELNTPAGVVDLRTGEVRGADPELLHTRSTAVAPDFERPSDVFDTFLHDTFGDDAELAGYVQRLIGVSAIGCVLEQLLPFAVGPGANGKSTLLEAAMHALGRGDDGYARAGSSEMLMVRKHAEHPAELAQLSGARLVVCAELDEGQRFAEARVKQLTGRDSLSARFMRRDWFTFEPSHTLWLLGNHLPAARAGGPAFWRRIRVLPFNRVVPPQRQDKKLGERLAQDAPAVLAWIIAGAAAYHQGGLREPASVSSATEAYARDQDTVGRFVDEQCHRQPGSAGVRTAVSVLRDAYERWCEQLGERPVSAKRLTQELQSRFGVADARGGKGQRFYTGIALLDVDDPQTVLPVQS
ncbi:phage/plasmid primase, P4 family [Couchioplanes caeruleus]|uniref:phage/plasmid primase, P4 family n=1 Tax=Couchioplanes caeruleus TaxID=56438 RepID=UPI00201C2768|nr:phage/plasmid primase, P4 family [Couchioplanes caeruleus]UQU67343.1 phage/plasmid primase, P4 family [Couchioplanes caeruleus]